VRTLPSSQPAFPPFLAVGDVSGFIQTYDNKNVGSSKTLTPSGSVVDGNNGANYNVTFFSNPNGVITWITTTNVLISSLNPSAVGNEVTFTATVSEVPPGTNIPTGQILFYTTNRAFATNELINGSSSASISTLPVGTNLISVIYFGDNIHAQSLGTLNQVVTNSIIYSTTNVILSIANNNNGTLTLNLAGTPGAQYYIVSSPDITVPMSSWTIVGGSTNTASNPDGLWSHVAGMSDSSTFYRSVAVNPSP